MITLRIFLVLLLVVVCTEQVGAVTIPTVPIGKPGNLPDEFGGGQVSYIYRIGTTEVTNAQYVEFLNAVAASDPYRLYSEQMASSTLGGIVRTGLPESYTYAVKPAAIGQGPDGNDYAYDNKPVVFVSWFEALRFTNWLHNGQGNADTENGVYTLVDASPYGADEAVVPSNHTSIVRNPGARWWLPSLNEWYKAAAYDPSAEMYYDYPTGTNAVPNNHLPSADTGNSANFCDPYVVFQGCGSYATGSSLYPMTDVGAYERSASPYGTRDQLGNIAEWNEVRGVLGEDSAGIRGGSWSSPAYDVMDDRPYWFLPGDDLPWFKMGHVGFRVATIIPEPSTFVLLGLGIFLLGRRIRR